MSLTYLNFKTPSFIALSSDIDINGKIPGLSIIGAKVYLTDTKVWKVVLADLTLGDYSSGAGGVAADTIWDAKGDLAVGTGANTAAKLTVGSNGTIIMADSTQTTGIKWANNGSGLVSTIMFTIDGGGSAITTGIKGDIMMDFACTINSATLLADQSGSIVIDLWKDVYANYPPLVGDTITASAKPTLSTATNSQDTTLTGWTKTINAGDIIRVNVDSAATVTRVLLALKVTRT